MSFPPTTYLIGAQKAGTTYLANLLAQHPDIRLSQPKETAFYTRNWDKGLEWYRSCFPTSAAPILLDATPGYTAAPLPELFSCDAGEYGRLEGVPKRIYSICPNARFIYILREPVARTYSSYWHNVRTKQEHMKFRDALVHDSFYMRTSCYWAQLKRYLEYFSRDSVLVLLFEDFRREPAATARKCFHFLGLEEYPELHLPVGRNRSYTLAPWADAIQGAVRSWRGSSRLISATKYLIPEHIRWKMARKFVAKDIPPIHPEDRRYLEEFFAPLNEALMHGANISLDSWRQPRL